MTAFIRKFNLCSFKISFSSYVSFTIYGCNSDFVLLYGEFEAKKKNVWRHHCISQNNMCFFLFNMQSFACNFCVEVGIILTLIHFQWRWCIHILMSATCKLWNLRELIKVFLTVFWFAEGSGKQLWCNTWREENCLEDDIYSVLVY